MGKDYIPFNAEIPLHSLRGYELDPEYGLNLNQFWNSIEWLGTVKYINDQNNLTVVRLSLALLRILVL